MTIISYPESLIENQNPGQQKELFFQKLTKKEQLAKEWCHRWFREHPGDWTAQTFDSLEEATATSQPPPRP